MVEPKEGNPEESPAPHPPTPERAGSGVRLVPAQRGLAVLARAADDIASMAQQAALLQIHGVTLAVLQVPYHVVANPAQAHRVIDVARRRRFPLIPVVLMAWERPDTPVFFGRDDLVHVLAARSPLDWRWISVTL